MKIQAPDGGFYEFPDDAKDSEIEDFINQQHPSPEQAISFAAQMGSTIPAKVGQMMEAGALAAPGAREAAEQQRFEKANPYAQAQLEAGQKIGPMGPVDPYDILRLPELLTIPGKVMEPIAQASEDIFSDFLKNTPAAGAIGMARDALNIQPEPGKPLIPVGRIPSALGMVSDALTRTGVIEPNRFTEFMKGSEEEAGRTAEGFLTPGQIPMLAAAPGSKLLQGLFAAQAAAEVPESVRQIIESKSPQELGSAVTGAAANLGMAAMMGHALLKGESPYAGRVKEATEVHGDLRSQPGKGPGQVSTQESGAGIFPLPEDLGQATQVLLRQGQENNQRLGLGHQIQVLDNFGTHDPDNIRPFRADMPAPDGTPGRIQMSREGLKNWLATIPKDRQAQAVQTALAEEGIHSTVLPETAVQYLETLTPAERAIGEKLYLGPHTWDELGVDPAIRPLLVGHELLRQRMQRLLRMEPTEIQEVVGKEKWTKQSVEMIARVIRRIRELAGTKAAKAGTEITDQLLRQYESRINSAAKVVGLAAPFPERSDKGEELGGEEPFLISRNEPTHESDMDFARRVVKMTPEEFTKEAKSFNRINLRLGQRASEADVTELKKLRDEAIDRFNEAFKKAKADPSEKNVDEIGRLGSMPQFFNEAISEAEKAKPAALSRKKGEPEPELYLPPVKEAVERPGTGFVPAAKDFENETMRHLTESAAPNFSTFLKEAKQKLGDLQPGAARDVWQTQVWKRLMAAAPEELKRMARNMGMDKYIPGGEMAGPEKSPKASEFSLKGEIIDPEAAKEANTLEVAGNERMREDLARRYSLIATLGQKLIGQAQTGKRAWARDLINPEEIADPKIETKQPVYHEIAPAAQSNIEALGNALTDDARAFGGAKITKTADGQKVTIQQKGLPVSVTKRVTAIQDKTTGRVSLVSTFRDGRRGAVLLDPQSPKQTHSTLDSILNRYRVISSALLDEPVKDFREDFRTLKEFQDHFGEPARRAAEKFAGYEEPAKEQAPEEYTPPTFDQPITDSEASSIIDHLEGEVGTFEGPDDVLLAIEGLKEKPNRQAASAYGKLAAELQKKNPDLSTEDLLKKLAKQIYEDHTASKTLEDFQRRTMEKGPAPDRGTLGTKVQAEGAKLQEPSKATPAVLTRQKQELKDQWTLLKHAFTRAAKRRKVKEVIPAMLDGADGTAAQFAVNSGNHIRAQSKDVKVREAAVALIAAGDIEKPGSLLAGQWFANPKFLPQLFQHLDNGELRARQWLLERNPVRKVYARKWIKAIEHMREGLRYAQDHWNDPDLQDVALAVRKELKDTIDWENANGSNVQERQNHYPGRYEGEFWSDNGLNFGGNKVLGTQYRYPKKFANPYEAISKGPYIQASFDPADVVEHRVRAGHRIVEHKMWEEAVKGIRDPDGMNIAKDPVPYTAEVKDPRTGEVHEEQRWKSPGPEYTLVKPFGWQKPMAVLNGYEKLVRSVTANSHIDELPLGKEALVLGSDLKHGFILVADTFHIGRVGQYAAALLGLGKVGFRGGHAALSFRPEDLAAAVHQGYITQAAADWAMEPVRVKVMRRRPTATGWQNVPDEITMTRHDLGKEMISQGLNAAKISDALYKDAIQNIPFIGKAWHRMIGPFNDFLFGRFMPGLILETAVRNFEKYNTAHPDIPVNRLMRDVIKDTNVFYGNMGRQGVFKNATFRDLSQIFLLAPLWQEGLIQKEARFAGRLTGISALTGRRGLPYMGTLGSGMANGLLTYFALSQLVNLITKRQFTWQNEEKGRKLDAWIPTGNGKGFWLSPLTTFAEVTHDIIRLAETKPTVFDAFMQMGSNRLGPIGKMGYILTTGKSPTGEEYSTSRGRLAGGIGQVVPFVGPGPISFSGPARVAAHALFPEQVKPAPRGTLIRQGLASLAGIKVQPGDTAVQMVSRAAEDFVKKEGLKKSTGWKQVQTDEPSYSKLRAAVRNDDPKGIKEQYHALLKDRTQDEIVRAMQNWGKRGFTGSNEGEMKFVGSLNDRELELYNQALKEKNDTLEAFIDWLVKQP